MTTIISILFSLFLYFTPTDMDDMPIKPGGGSDPAKSEILEQDLMGGQKNIEVENDKKLKLSTNF